MVKKMLFDEKIIISIIIVVSMGEKKVWSQHDSKTIRKLSDVFDSTRSNQCCCIVTK